MKNVFLAAGLISLFSINAYAQAPVLGSGTHIPHHAGMWTAQGVLQDAGPKTGGGPNVGISDLPIVGTGTPLCIYDAPVTNSLGYHYLCLGSNDGNKGLISFGAGGTAAQIPFELCSNGSCFEFPFTVGSGVMGSPPTAVNDVTCFNNTVGTLIKSCGGITGAAGTLTATATVSAAQYNLTTIPFANRGGNSHTIFDYDGAAAIVLYGSANNNVNYYIGDTHIWQNNGLVQTASLNSAGLFAPNAITTSGNIQSTAGNILACASPCETGLTTTGNIVATNAVTGSFLGSTGSINAATTINAAQYNLRGTMFAEMDSSAVRTAIYDVGNNQNIVLYPTGFNYYQNNEHQFRTRTSSGATTYAIFNAGGSFNQTGTWGVISDDSLKENVAPYVAGLDKLITLNPVSYNYITLPSPRTSSNPFSDTKSVGQKLYGLMASNVKPELPEMVKQQTFGTVSGNPTSPVDTLMPTHLIYVIINSIKEMNTRLIAVETAAGVQKK